MNELVLWAALIAIVVVHWILSRSKIGWLGAILPSLWLCAVAGLALAGHMTGFRDWFMAVFGQLVLLVLWGSGMEARNKRLKQENDRIDNTIF